MNILFRADASREMGSGHIMRCLTLAEVLRERGGHCHFVCQSLLGDMVEFVQARGFPVSVLHGMEGWQEDAAQVRALCLALAADWVVVDHYALGLDWEEQVSSATKKLFVMDDIGRCHRCDILLDQNFHNPVHDRYRKQSGRIEKILLGPGYALVRPEFSALRPPVLNRRNGRLSRWIISMGGSDAGNETGKALEGLMLAWQSFWSLDVVIGASNPNGSVLRKMCDSIPRAVLHVQTDKMARLMAEADCAISAGGSTTWERCCLGLPALVCALSDDQVAIAGAVAGQGGQIYLGRAHELGCASYAAAIDALSEASLIRVSELAAGICDGLGARRVADILSQGLV